MGMKKMYVAPEMDLLTVSVETPIANSPQTDDEHGNVTVQPGGGDPFEGEFDARERKESDSDFGSLW